MTERRRVEFDPPTVTPGPSIDELPKETPLEAIKRLRAEIIQIKQEIDQHEARFKELNSSEDRTAIRTKEGQVEAAREEINAHFDTIIDEELAKNT